MPLNNKNIYRKDFKKYGLSPRSMGWKDKKAQEVRYSVLLKDLDPEGKSILDFGCGMGDIIPNILAETSDFEYKGVDTVKEFINVANATHKIPQVKFIVRDFIKHPLRKKFDIVICSGALNSNISDALGYRKKAIKILWEHAEEVLIFNMAGSCPQPVNKIGNRVFYADSLDILKYCLSFTSCVIFHTNYRKNDFTITMFR